MGRLNDKVAFITGAGSGIGRATASLFAAEGALIVLADKNETAIAAEQSAIEAVGGRAVVALADVTEETSVRAAVDLAMSAYGRIDILFNCAGGSVVDDGPVTDVDLSVWNGTIKLDLLGTFLCCRTVIPHMVAQRRGTIVNTATWGALRGAHPKHVYTAAKGGVIALTRSIAGEYTSAGIRANTICPGSVKTERWHVNANKTVAEFAKRRQFGIQYPFSVGSPEDVAAIVLFLASDESRMITGATIPADGGRSAF